MGNFNPLFPHGKRQKTHVKIRSKYNFNPLFPHGKRLLQVTHFPGYRQFQPTLPSREETFVPIRLNPESLISTHSSLTGRDSRWDECVKDSFNFNPLFPHGKRPTVSGRCSRAVRFQPTLPSREETGERDASGAYTIISTHSSLTGRDGCPAV